MVETLVLDLAGIAATAAGLWWGALWLVESSARVARRVGLSELVIGLTVVAFGTSAPEFAVSVQAALTGQADISFANVVGSNFFNLGLVLGIAALFGGVATTPLMVRRDGGVVLAATAMVLLLSADGRLGRLEGGLLAALLLVYLAVILRRGETPDEEVPEGEFRWWDVPLLLVGLAMVVVSGRLLVDLASSLAREVGVSEWLIGLTIVAGGTSLPELATSAVAALRGRAALSAGNLLGSNLFNLLGVLGVAAAASARPLVADQAVLSGMVVLLGFTALALALMRSGWRVSPREGAVLVAVNIAYWVLDYLLE